MKPTKPCIRISTPLIHGEYESCWTGELREPVYRAGFDYLAQIMPIDWDLPSWASWTDYYRAQRVAFLAQKESLRSVGLDLYQQTETTCSLNPNAGCSFEPQNWTPNDLIVPQPQRSNECETKTTGAISDFVNGASFLTGGLWWKVNTLRQSIDGPCFLPTNSHQHI